MPTLCNCITLLLFSAFFASGEDFRSSGAENEKCCGSHKISIVIQNLSIDIPGNVFKNVEVDDDKVGRIAKDGVDKPETTPVLSMDSWAMAEETRRKYCSEIDNSTQKIVLRSEWRATKVSTSEKRTKKADLLIVEGNSFKSDEAHWMRGREEFEFSYFGDHLSNFYIADDGTVFEGLGWDHWNSVANGGLGDRSIIVFFTAFVDVRPPSEAALRAYDQLVKAAICRNILSLDYKLIPKYLVWDYRPLGKKDFEKVVMSDWDRYTDDLGFIFGSDNVDHGLFPVAVREEWTEEALPKDMFTITPPIEYVVISNLGSRCFNYQGCIQEVKSLDKFLKMQNLLFLPNFVVGEDGRGYEVIGWDNANTGELGREKAILVLFAGEFNGYHPHPRALTTFNRMMKFGIWLGKVSTDYKIAFASGDNIPTSDGLKAMFQRQSRLEEYPFKL